jgi:hypothetical protein
MMAAIEKFVIFTPAAVVVVGVDGVGGFDVDTVGDVEATMSWVRPWGTYSRHFIHFLTYKWSRY